MAVARHKVPVRTARSRPIVLKLGGELLESDAKMAAMARTIVALSRTARLIVVHGGGREIDAALARVGIPTRQVDGLRITDAATLDIVVSVLAGSINTRFVAAINAAGGTAVGLTGADAAVAPVKKTAAHTSTAGDLVDLGLVGRPQNLAAPRLVQLLCANNYVPVIACVSAGRNGQLFNVNADTLAGSLAARLKAATLVFAGGTAGVLDADGQTIPALDGRGVRTLVKNGTATAGMVAKLVAAHAAAKGGVSRVQIASGREPKTLEQLVAALTPNGTRITK